MDKLARDIAATSFWRDGWIAVRQTRTYDGKGMEPLLRDRLTALEEFLRPKDLVSQVRGLVIGSRAGNLDLEDFEEDEEDGSDPTARYAARAARTAAAIRELGHDLTADDKAFKAVLPELIGGNTEGSALRRGLSRNCRKSARDVRHYRCAVFDNRKRKPPAAGRIHKWANAA